ncbi:response regulator [Desulfosporosinus sp. Sb-LF]|uniref:response regulator n=1 Tax=Desulfosporosinus sp. Sb-LF TaxID=2560027 RepID=UPI00107EEBCA|nr:response regulator [Desulfosporosinus sp. Sb-LF]TGE32933.1 response regulator [Desulfosporosinus sp. Sb-LF]
MRILIAEDDLTSRKFMQRFLTRYGECDVAVDGLETIDSFLSALKENKPYDLVCLDIMMPKLDGLKALRMIRDIEQEKKIADLERVKVIMTTALNDQKTVLSAYGSGCEAYAWKPIDVQKFTEVLQSLGLIDDKQEMKKE